MNDTLTATTSADFIEQAEQVMAAPSCEMREYRLFGPPGTGKTTTLKRWIGRAAERFGPEAVIATSFSRAAAAELVGRDLPISADQIGTLHSLAYRALDGPRIAEANLEQWNRDYPDLRLTPAKRSKADLDEPPAEADAEGAAEGDVLLQELSRLRGLMIPEEGWPARIRHFAEKWTEYKRQHGLLDFTDLIQAALHDVHAAPGRPAVIFADESQDLSPLQFALLRKWGREAEYLVICGDDDQTIYGWTGASPDSMLDPPLPASQIRVLEQSHRVPRAVHGLAESIIRRVARRQPKQYRPRDADGRCEFLHATSMRPGRILDLVEACAGRGQTVMLLASCGYMLQPIIAGLRKRGIPYHNPYRTTNGAWNPIRKDKPGSAANRVLALIDPLTGAKEHWTARDAALWTEWLSSKGLLKPDGKSYFARFSPEAKITLAELGDIFLPVPWMDFCSAYGADYPDLLRWWRARLMSSVQERAEFPVAVALARGPQALKDTPKVIVGTIHSVKGGQADVVIILPDLSRAAAAEYERRGEGHDSIVRTFYVGVTRARQSVYLAEPAGRMAFRW